jgi:hypothetical protein
MTNRAQHPIPHRWSTTGRQPTRQLRSQAVPAYRGLRAASHLVVVPVEGGEAVESMPIVDPAGTAEPCKTFTRQGFVNIQASGRRLYQGADGGLASTCRPLCAVR